ncbi:putative uncharacterized protein DDB_G0277255 [Octopus bimaculoides]|uniref:Uncharacterized protein n=1 Tax=Octopus bimaculoides TaxID=37653 RepID=A0A0L8FIP7_OCTBM|nr:putative uncharacterized protein DDB_G0277255 [Octopus bimaculoides]
MLWLKLIVLCFGLYFNSLTLLVAGVNRNEDSRHSTSAPAGRVLSRGYSRKTHNHHHHHPHHHHQQNQRRTTSSRQHQGDSADDGKESTKLRLPLKENSGKSVVALEDGYTKRRHDEFYGDRAQQTETSINRKISVYTPEGHSSKDNKHNNNHNKHHHHHKNKNHNKNIHHHNSKDSNTNTTTTNNSKNKNHNNINNNIKHKDNGTSLPNKCPKCRQRDNEMQLRLALIKDNILKYLGLSTAPDIKDPSIPQILTVQHAISGHTMQKDSPFHSGRKQDFDNEFGGHTLRPLQRILVSHLSIGSIQRRITSSKSLGDHFDTLFSFQLGMYFI